MLIGKVQEFKKKNPVLWVTLPMGIREYLGLQRSSQIKWDYFEKEGKKIVQITKHEE